MEVDGVKPSSFHGHFGRACKAHSFGSPLAAMLARSWDQSAQHAGPALSASSLSRFQPKTGGIVGARFCDK